MRVLEKRLRRLEEGLLPSAETVESRDLHERVLAILRRRAALGRPEPENVPAPVSRPGMSLVRKDNSRARAPAPGRDTPAMTSKNLARRLERLEDCRSSKIRWC